MLACARRLGGVSTPTRHVFGCVSVARLSGGAAVRAEEVVPSTTLTPSPLTDSFGRKHTYLRISLTERCNLRCTYCMPADGVELCGAGQLLTFDEIMRLARLFVQQGVTKIRLTGGEPLVRRDIVELCEGLSALRSEGLKSLGMTTNGITLKRKLPKLHEAGLTHINVSLDTLNSDKYTAITRRPGMDRVLAAIDAAVEYGYDPLKINCVVMRGMNEEELCDFVEMTRKLPVTLRFIEYMPFDSNQWADSKFVSFKEMLTDIRSVYPTIEPLPPRLHDTTKEYQVPGFAGKVGFITSMSANFCGGCNRVRLNADGSLKVCLFDGSEVSLRDAMRAGATDDDLMTVVRAALGDKKAALGGHGDMFGIAKSSNRPMILIGG